jgi:hypothetical protein
MSKTGLVAKEKILHSLRENKEELSAAQLRARYGIKGIYRRIHELRKFNGEPIYTNVKIGADGRKRYTYRYGSHTQKMQHVLFNSKNLARDWGRVIPLFYARALGTRV